MIDQHSEIQQLHWQLRQLREQWVQCTGMNLAISKLSQEAASRLAGLSNVLENAQNHCTTLLQVLQDSAEQKESTGTFMYSTLNGEKQDEPKPPSGKPQPAGRPPARGSKRSTRKAAKAALTGEKSRRRSSSVGVTKLNPNIVWYPKKKRSTATRTKRSKAK